jgi:putative heme-binding domain-containing protein
MNTVIETDDGRVISGRIMEETDERLVLKPQPLETDTVTIQKSEIESRKLSKVSPMPAGLLNNFSKDEILDLMAYLESFGDSKHPNFKK